jgi:ATP-dependent Clp protease ATP-binding subunit ClpA
MPAQQPALANRVRWVIRTQLAAVSPARKHTPGVHTRATGFLPLTGPARGAVAAAFSAARRDGRRHWNPGQLLLGLSAQDQGTAARALRRLGISHDQVRQQVAQATVPARRQVGPAPHPAGGTALAAAAEAAAHCDYSIGSDHLLLALFRADDQAAAQVLTRLGTGESQVRSAVTALRTEHGPERSA